MPIAAPIVGEEEHAIGDRGGVRVVGDHHGRLPETRDHVAQELQDLALGRCRRGA
jgi:hypothetical protein